MSHSRSNSDDIQILPELDDRIQNQDVEDFLMIEANDREEETEALAQRDDSDKLRQTGSLYQLDALHTLLMDNTRTQQDPSQFQSGFTQPIPIIKTSSADSSSDEEEIFLNFGSGKIEVTTTKKSGNVSHFSASPTSVEKDNNGLKIHIHRPHHGKKSHSESTSLAQTPEGAATFAAGSSYTGPTHLQSDEDWKSIFTDFLKPRQKVEDTTTTTTTTSTTSTSSTSETILSWEAACQKYGIKPLPLAGQPSDDASIADFFDLKISNVVEGNTYTDEELKIDDFVEIALEPVAANNNKGKEIDDPESDISTIFETDQVNNNPSTETPHPFDNLLKSFFGNAEKNPQSVKEIIQSSMHEWFKDVKEKTSKRPIFTALAVVTTGQPLISAFLNISGKSPEDIVQATKDMTPAQLTMSIVNAFSSFLVNYPFNLSSLLDAKTRVQNNLTKALESPQSFFEAVISVSLGASAAIANGALAFDAFIFFVGIFGGYLIPASIGSFAALINFTSRWTAILRALDAIKNIRIWNEDARIQLNLVESLMSQLDLDFQINDHQTLRDILDAALKSQIEIILKDKREFSQENFSELLSDQENKLLSFISLYLSYQYQLENFKLASFDELSTLTLDKLNSYKKKPVTSAESNETTPLIRQFSIQDEEEQLDDSLLIKLQNEFNAFKELKEKLLSMEISWGEKREYLSEIFKVFNLTTDSDSYCFETVGNIENVTESNPISILKDQAFQKFLEIKSHKLKNLDLDKPDYEKLLLTLVKTIDEQTPQHKHSFFKPKPAAQTAGEWLLDAGRVIFAICFGIVGGAIYLEKAWNGIEDIEKIATGHDFSKDQLSDKDKTAIGFAGGLASAMLYAIAAAEFPRLFFKVLPEALKNNKISGFGVLIFLVTNFFASTSMESVAKGVLNKEDVLGLVKKLLSFNLLSEEQTKAIMPYVVRLGGGMVNMRPTLSDLEPKPEHRNEPTTEDILNYHSHPTNKVSKDGLNTLRHVGCNLGLFSERPASKEGENPLVHSTSFVL